MLWRSTDSFIGLLELLKALQKEKKFFTGLRRLKGNLEQCGVSGKMVEKIKSLGVDPGSGATGLMGCGPGSSLVDGYCIREAGSTKCDPAAGGCPKLINRGARNRRICTGHSATLPQQGQGGVRKDPSQSMRV